MSDVHCIVSSVKCVNFQTYGSSFATFGMNRTLPSLIVRGGIYWRGWNIFLDSCIQILSPIIVVLGKGGG